MPSPGKQFVPLLPPQDTRPRSSFQGPHTLHNIIRDQFSITTWLCLGAVIQGCLILAVGRLALLPASSVLIYYALDAYAIATGWKRNSYMDGVLLKKFSAQFPDAEGRYGPKPADSDVVVLLIGVRCNHPLGMLAPGFKDIGDYFKSMVDALEANADEFGFLGMTSWMNSSDRQSKSEYMQIAYFKSTEGLHAFAHSEHHRAGWDFWSRTNAKYSHVSIWHEIYHAPKGHWESIYANSHIGGINTTTHKIFDQASGTTKWASPVVDASKGLLRTSQGRMSRSAQADEHEKYGYEYNGL